MSKKILVLDIFSDNKDVLEENHQAFGSYVARISKHMGADLDEFESIPAWDKVIDDPNKYSAVILGRSLHYADERETAWMLRVYDFIRKTTAANIPLLGLCGGMQFVARALGGIIGSNPKGKEIGTQTISLTSSGISDPLFEDTPTSFPAQLVHTEMLTKLKDDWVVLASSEVCPVQAVGIGENVRLVQFHPEYSAEDMRKISERHGASVETYETPESHKILSNFYKNFVASTNR